MKKIRAKTFFRIAIGFLGLIGFAMAADNVTPLSLHEGKTTKKGVHIVVENKNINFSQLPYDPATLRIEAELGCNCSGEHSFHLKSQIFPQGDKTWKAGEALDIYLDIPETIDWRQHIGHCGGLHICIEAEAKDGKKTRQSLCSSAISNEFRTVRETDGVRHPWLVSLTCHKGFWVEYYLNKSFNNGSRGTALTFANKFPVPERTPAEAIDFLTKQGLWPLKSKEATSAPTTEQNKAIAGATIEPDIA